MMMAQQKRVTYIGQYAYILPLYTTVGLVRLHVHLYSTQEGWMRLIASSTTPTSHYP